MLSTIVALFAFSAGAELCAVADLPCQADHIAKSYHIGRAARGANEVRVYRSAMWSGTGSAWIVLPGKPPSQLRRGEAKVVVDSTAFGDFAKLGRLDGSVIGCGTKDGVRYVIDGYVSGDRFTLVASNPSACDAPDAKAVSSALAILPPHD